LNAKWLGRHRVFTQRSALGYYLKQGSFLKQRYWSPEIEAGKYQKQASPNIPMPQKWRLYIGAAR
jgi:hypothetical protein